MTLRIMLVGLVASLGFELPSRADVECWAEAGTSWVNARMDDPSDPKVEVKLDLAGPSDRLQADDAFEVPALAGEVDADADMAFAGVAEKVVADLSADLLASHRDETPGEAVEAKLAGEGPVTVGLPEGEEAGCLIVRADEAGAVEAESAEVVESEPAVAAESTSRDDRVFSAVRLTVEAVQAWAGLLQKADCDEAQPCR